jgi:hypothetical protein
MIDAINLIEGNEIGYISESTLEYLIERLSRDTGQLSTAQDFLRPQLYVSPTSLSNILEVTAPELRPKMLVLLLNHLHRRDKGSIDSCDIIERLGQGPFGGCRDRLAALLYSADCLNPRQKSSAPLKDSSSGLR